ncbi:hypothetical protein SADUNF_Sadunf08G0092200 [Salix dunnii]|uniref:Uncharacterized protein n=1 Tax=Salix dunnii TaxID=1413687 RepID=A0A835MXQ0_9ROSI|nr:hypothetical protein SADUNF_Sadunf08G0092200 [Salix dunnii]
MEVGTKPWEIMESRKDDSERLQWMRRQGPPSDYLENTNTAEEDGSADWIECAVDNGFGGGRDFLSDWFGCFCFLTKRCGYNVDDLFFSEAAALRLL